MTSKFSREELLDFKEALILPGFVGARTRLYSTFRGIVADLPFWSWKLEITKLSSNISEVDWENSAELGALEAVRARITAIGDINYKKG